jgi:putative intracellular protease/amidase
MRKVNIFIIVVIIAGSILFSLQAFGQSGRKVLLIPREGYSTDLDLMIEKEVGVMTSLLKKAGYEVDIATPSGKSILGSYQKIEKVARLSEINLDNYSGVMLACMAMALRSPVSPEVVAVVKKALADGKPVAAAANSNIILAEAGLLKGKKYARFADPLVEPEPGWPDPDPRFKGAIYSGKGVVQDGQIITSAVCPALSSVTVMQDGTAELTQKFIAMLNPK